MTTKKNDDVVAVVPPNEVHYRGVRKKQSGKYGAESRNLIYVWFGTLDTPEQVANPKAKTNFSPTNEDNLENPNPMNVSDVNNPYQSSDFRSSSRFRDKLVNNQNPLLTHFSVFNSEDSTPLQTALEEYYLEILRRSGVISRDPKQTNYIQKETTGDFIDDNDSGSESGSRCEVQNQPPTILNSILTSLLPGRRS